jgi:hypothetical protein
VKPGSWKSPHPGPLHEWKRGEPNHCPVGGQGGEVASFSSLPLVERSRMRALGIVDRASGMPAKNVGKNPGNQGF